ncbi:hypothetical protein IIC65_00180 [Candidatus Sumerlaeota bacterium]|nr:hypothetical protein [Candidatus Sumerlaeota bacterium]
MNTDLAVYAPDPVSASSSSGLGLAQAAEQERFLGTQKWKVIVPPPDSLPTAPAYFTSSMILAMGTFLSLLIGGLLFRQQVVAEKSQSEALHSRTKLASTSDNLVRVKEELDLILNNVDEAIILYDENLSPLQANAAFQKAFSPVGNSVSWLRGAEEHHRQMLRHFQNESQYRALLNNLRESPEKPFSDELEGRRTEQDETPTYYQRWATAVCNADGSRRGYLLVYQDLTHTRAVERLKEDFLSNVTHDLRTPLAAIKGFAQTMLRSSDMDSATRMEFTNIICDESTRLQDLIDDLLDLRRMEDGQSDLSPSTYDMHALIDEMVRSSKAMLDPYDVTIDVQWDGKSHKSLLGDAAMIGRALRNILSNAVKHSPDHGTIWIKAVESEDRVELEFTDEGLGIPSEDLPHVFEKFYRGARRLRGTQGTGLGLAIVKHIIESHGGVVSASNAVPRGACIKIVLPREVDPGFGHLAETSQSRRQAVSI